MAHHTEEVARAARNVNAARRRVERSREELRVNRRDLNEAHITLERAVAEESRHQAGRRRA